MKTTTESPFINLPPITLPDRERARLLFYMRWSQKDIAAMLERPESTISSWKIADGWEESTPWNQAIESITARLLFELSKPKLGNGEGKAIDILTRSLERLAKPAPVKQTRANSRVNSNEFDEVKFNEQIIEKFMDELYPFQRQYIENIAKYEKRGESQLIARDSLLLKSRQTGFTFSISRFNTVRLVEKQHNQIYMSSSKNQALQARSYVQNFVRDATGVEIGGGDRIVFPNNKEYFFLGSNPSTAQGYTGDVTCDEFMWWKNFESLKTAVTGCATHKQFITNFLSTASSKRHPGYRFWAGSEWNDRNDAQVKSDHQYLKDGAITPDGRYRQIITLLDAVESGFDLVDIEQLRLRHPDPDDFAQLFMCEFMDEKTSVFRYEDIYGCMIDVLEEWDDFEPYLYAHRPFGDKPVAVGYDPARYRDSSVCVVGSPPDLPGGKWRILEKHFWDGQDFEQQTEAMLDILNRYNVVHLGMDETALGLAVADRIEKFYPNITRYDMNQQLKAQFILQARNNFKKRSVELDFGWTDLLSSFLSIKQVETRSRGLTYDSERNSETNHADLSWATMFMFGYEPFDGSHINDSSESTIFKF